MVKMEVFSRIVEVQVKMWDMKSSFPKFLTHLCWVGGSRKATLGPFFFILGYIGSVPISAFYFYDKY